MSKPPCLLLIRHAQSQNNALDDQYRVPDPEITALGHSQSQRLSFAVEKLKPTIVYCSPFRRSLQTTRPVAERTGLTPIVRQDLYEQGGCHRGHLKDQRFAVPGLSRQELANQFPGWHLDERIGDGGWYDLDHYESEEESRIRARSVRRWFESNGPHRIDRDRVVMVIHADFKLRLLEAFLERTDIEVSLGDVVNTSITCISLHKGRWRMDYWNVHEHLDDDLVSC